MNKIIFNNSLGDISAVNVNTGDMIWQTPTQSSLIYEDSFLLKTSDLIADDDAILLSNNRNEFNDFRLPESSLIVVPVFQEKRGNPVLFSREFREKILQHKGEGCRGILKEYPQCVMEVMMENDNVFRDVDTPEDYVLNS